MIVKIKRIAKKYTYTIGKMYIDGVYVCDTIEDKDRGLTQSMSVEDIKKIKVYGKTAIPAGSYTLERRIGFKNKSWAKKWDYKIPMILDVKGFTGVFIHVGNTADDSLGCPLVGENKVVGKVINSQKTFNLLMEKYIVPAFNKKESIKLIIE